MALLSMRNVTQHLLWISMFLLLLALIQMLTTLLVSAGVYIASSDVLIGTFGCTGPYQYCRSPEVRAVFDIDRILNFACVLGFHVPVVLVPFALLALMFAGYTKDSLLLSFGTCLQGVSSFLMLMGIISLLLRYPSYVQWENMTTCFYVSVAVQIELGVTTALTFVSGRRLKCDWDKMDLDTQDNGSKEWEILL